METPSKVNPRSHVKVKVIPSGDSTAAPLAGPASGIQTEKKHTIKLYSPKQIC